MTTADRPSAELIRAAIADARDVYDHARDVLADETDPHHAFELATEFAVALRALADDGADLRAAAVGRIWENEATSLAKLAQKIGVSKARAAQLVQTARSANEKALPGTEERD